MKVNRWEVTQAHGGEVGGPVFLRFLRLRCRGRRIPVASFPRLYYDNIGCKNFLKKFVTNRELVRLIDEITERKARLTWIRTPLKNFMKLFT